MRLERTDDAAALLKRAVAIARGTSSGEMLVWLLGVQAWALWLQLDLDAALAAAEAAEETARLQAAPNPLLLALSVRAAIHHDRGEPRRGRARRRRLRRADRRARAQRDDADGGGDARRAVRRPRTPSGASPSSTGVALDPSWAGRARAAPRARGARGRPPRGRRPLRPRRGGARRVVTLPLAAIRAELGTAEVLLARGEPGRGRARGGGGEAAEGRATPARASTRASRRRRRGRSHARHRSALDAAEARLLQGRALAAAGDTEAAKAVLQRVAADAARGGASG